MKLRIIKIFASILIIGIYFKTNNVAAHYNQINKKILKKQHIESKYPIIGVSGDWGRSFEDKNFNIQRIEDGDFALINPVGFLTHFNATSFNAKNEYVYGANFSYGYLKKNNFESNLELGYHQIKNTDSKETDEGGIPYSLIQSNIISIMANGIFYANIHSIRPYINLGAGIAYTKAHGIIDGFLPDPHTLIPATETLSFKNLKATKLAYQSGLGLTTTAGSAILGIGYKFFTVSDISDKDDLSSDLSVELISPLVDGVQVDTLKDNSNFKFGILSNRTHNISIFAKKLI